MVIGGIGMNKYMKINNDFINVKQTKIKKFELNNEQLKALKFLDKVDNKFDVSVLAGDNWIRKNFSIL